MKTIFSTQVFKKHLALHTAKASKSRKYFLQIVSGGICMKSIDPSSNLKTQTIVRCSGSELNNNSYEVDFNELKVCLSSLKDNESKISFTDNDVLIECGNAKIKVKAVISQDETITASIDLLNTVKISLESNNILSKLRNAVRFTSNDDLRPTMGGINISCLEDRKYVIAATDGHRLYVGRGEFIDIKDINEESIISENKSYIIPREFIEIVDAVEKVSRELMQYGEFDYEPDAGVIYINENSCMYENGDIVFSSQLVSGNFPDFESIVTHLNGNVTVFAGFEDAKTMYSVTKWFEQCLNQFGVMTSLAKISCEIEDESKLIKLEGDSQMSGESISHKIYCEFPESNVGVKVGMSSHLLASVLELIKDEGLNIYYSTPSRPFVITGKVLTDSQLNDFKTINELFIIMPVII